MVAPRFVLLEALLVIDVDSGSGKNMDGEERRPSDEKGEVSDGHLSYLSSVSVKLS